MNKNDLKMERITELLKKYELKGVEMSERNILAFNLGYNACRIELYKTLSMHLNDLAIETSKIKSDIEMLQC